MQNGLWNRRQYQIRPWRRWKFKIYTTKRRNFASIKNKVNKRLARTWLAGLPDWVSLSFICFNLIKLIVSLFDELINCQIFIYINIYLHKYFFFKIMHTHTGAVECIYLHFPLISGCKHEKWPQFYSLFTKLFSDMYPKFYRN